MAELPGMVRKLLDTLDDGYRIEGEIAVHPSAMVEGGATLKGPLIIGPDCRIAGGSLLRAKCWLGGSYVVGPGVKVKSTIMFRGARLAHFNFVGDSILSQDVNLEAGTVIANYQNELSDPRLRLCYRERLIEANVLCLTRWLRAIWPGAASNP